MPCSEAVHVRLRRLRVTPNRVAILYGVAVVAELEAARAHAREDIARADDPLPVAATSALVHPQG